MNRSQKTVIVSNQCFIEMPESTELAVCVWMYNNNIVVFVIS